MKPDYKKLADTFMTVEADESVLVANRYTLRNDMLDLQCFINERLKDDSLRPLDGALLRIAGTVTNRVSDIYSVYHRIDDSCIAPHMMDLTVLLDETARSRKLSSSMRTWLRDVLSILQSYRAELVNENIRGALRGLIREPADPDNED